MKIFGIQIGSARQESTEESILRLVSLLKNTPSGYGHRDVYNELNALCLKNPNIVASLVFGEKPNKNIRDCLLFEYSKDHVGSCGLPYNPQWTKMMRELIIPRMTELPSDFQGKIRWYQDVHGL
jgi:hypothetical protein